jgi:hypothetical protein
VKAHSVSRLRVSLRALFHELLRFFYHVAFERIFRGDALFSGVFADVFGDSHRAKMRASCCVGHDESSSALFFARGVEELNPEVIGVVGAR